MKVDRKFGGVTMERTDRWAAPSYFREDTRLPFGTVSIYGDGKTGWISSPLGQAPVAPLLLKPIQDKLLRLYFPMPLYRVARDAVSVILLSWDCAKTAKTAKTRMGAT
jgi:hypothetical protein